MSNTTKITEVDETSSQDNNLTDIQKRTQNMLDNAKEQIKKAKDKVKNTRPSELAEVEFPNKPWPEMETHPVERPEDETHPEEGPEDETHPEEGPEVDDTSSQDKGIIQLGILAVGIAGTVGAYVWGKN